MESISFNGYILTTWIVGGRFNQPIAFWAAMNTQVNNPIKQDIRKQHETKRLGYRIASINYGMQKLNLLIVYSL